MAKDSVLQKMGTNVSFSPNHVVGKHMHFVLIIDVFNTYETAFSLVAIDESTFNEL